MKQLLLLFLIINSATIVPMELIKKKLIRLTKVNKKPVVHNNVGNLNDLPQELKNHLITIYLAGELQDIDDIKQGYDKVKALSLVNKRYAAYFPNHFINWWYKSKNKKKYSKVRLAAQIGTVHWLENWIKNHRSNLRCTDSTCCIDKKEYKPLNELSTADDEYYFYPIHNAVIKANKYTSLLLYKYMKNLKLDQSVPEDYLTYFHRIFFLYNDCITYQEILELLHDSIKFSHDHVIKYVLAVIGKAKQQKAESLAFVIYSAIKEDDQLLLKRTFDYGADANQPHHGSLPLINACIHFRPEMILFLLSKGADLTLKDHIDALPEEIIRNYKKKLRKNNAGMDVRTYRDLSACKYLLKKFQELKLTS